MWRTYFMTSSCEMADRLRTPSMINKHWFWQWLGAVRQPVITCIKVDPGLWGHMTSLHVRHNELSEVQWISSFDWCLISVNTRPSMMSIGNDIRHALSAKILVGTWYRFRKRVGNAGGLCTELVHGELITMTQYVNQHEISFKMWSFYNTISG